MWGKKQKREPVHILDPILSRRNFGEAEVDAIRLDKEMQSDEKGVWGRFLVLGGYFTWYK